jgi:microcystin-dependent protein
MADTSTRFGISEPSADRSDPADVPLFIRNVVTRLEAVGAMFGQGTFAAMGAFGKQGRIYLATDQSKLYYDTGTAWVDVGALAPDSVTATEIAANAVGASEIASGAVGADEIADGTVGTLELADNSVNANKVNTTLKPSGGAGAGTEALRALGTGAGQAAAGTHAAQHGKTGADPITNIDITQLSAALQALFFSSGDLKAVAYDVVAGVNEPAGWLLCDGRSLLRTAFTSLFNVIGVAWGSVDGTHFTLPDFRGRAIVGKGQGAGLTNRVVGTYFGEESHVMTIAEMPLHDHGAATGNSAAMNTGTENQQHGHGISYDTSNAGSSGTQAPVVTVIGSGPNSGGSNTEAQQHTHPQTVHTHPITGQGGGGAHNNMQPSAFASVLIKT